MTKKLTALSLACLLIFTQLAFAARRPAPLPQETPQPPCPREVIEALKKDLKDVERVADEVIDYLDDEFGPGKAREILRRINRAFPRLYNILVRYAATLGFTLPEFIKFASRWGGVVGILIFIFSIYQSLPAARDFLYDLYVQMGMDPTLAAQSADRFQAAMGMIVFPPLGLRDMWMQMLNDAQNCIDWNEALDFLWGVPHNMRDRNPRNPTPHSGRRPRVPPGRGSGSGAGPCGRPPTTVNTPRQPGNNPGLPTFGDTIDVIGDDPCN